MLSNFEAPDDAAWTLSGSAEISSTLGAYSGDNALILFARRSVSLGNTNSTASRTFAVTPGRVYPIRLMLKGDDGGPVTLRMTLTDSSGSTVITLSPATAAGWELREPTSYTAIGSTLTVSFNTPTPGGSGNPGIGGRWLIDDFELSEEVTDEMAALGKWAAISNAIDVLKGIDGASSGYWTNLEGRAYTRLITPNENANMAKPYVCVPIVDENEQISYEDRLADRTWRITVYAYFDEAGQNDPLNSDAVELVAKFSDDLVRAFMEQQKLSGQTQGCSVVTVNSVAGVTDDYAEVQAVLAFRQMVGRAELGSGA